MTEYTDGTGALQLVFDDEVAEGHPEGWVSLPHGLTGFRQAGLVATPTPTGSEWTITGTLRATEEDRTCPRCGCLMTGHGSGTVTLRDVPLGQHHTKVAVTRPRYECPHCGATTYAEVPFQEEGHRITTALRSLAERLLDMDLTLTEVAEICGVDRHIVKDIDRRRLEQRHLENGRLRKPARQAKVLGIDEFLLHRGPVYASFVKDLESGEILWVWPGRGRDVVESFVGHVGQAWMARVEAVCCDMNAGFANAFLDECPHLAIVYDRFHIVKHFNEDVLDNIRKDEERRLREAGDPQGAAQLKRSKYLLCKTRDALAGMDAEGGAGRVVRRGSGLLGTSDVLRGTGKLDRYLSLIADNVLLVTADIVKEALADMYRERDAGRMEEKLDAVIDQCGSTGNEYFQKFARMLRPHSAGIVSHARFPFSSGKVEGTVNKIKTIRRRAYGYPDDEYFALKIIDAFYVRS